MLVNHFEGTGERFFYDSGDIDQHDFGGTKCQDLFGWIVPDDLVDSFRPIWLSGDDGELDSFAYASVSWAEGPDGRPVPVIDRGDGD